MGEGVGKGEGRGKGGGGEGKGKTDPRILILELKGSFTLEMKKLRPEDECLPTVTQP